MKLPKVVVVILNYRRPGETIECIASLKKSSYANMDLLVIDNASPDDSVQRICSAYDGVTVIVSEQNLGYAGGMNKGIRAAMQSAPAYIMVINSDTLIDENCIGMLVNVLEAEPEAAAASGMIYYDSDRKKIWYAGGSINYYRASGFQRNGYIEDTVEKETHKEVTFLSGCAFLVKSSALKDVGLFDERYFMYLEDTELFERLTRHHYRLLFVPQANVYHRVISDDVTPMRMYFSVRNRLLFLSNSGNLFQKVVGFFYLFGVFSMKYIVWNITKPPLAKAIRYGIQDYFSKLWYAGRAFQIGD